MVKIPLLRRQPKPNSSQAEGDGSREAKARDASRAEKKPPPAPAAPENRKPPAPQPVAENSNADPASAAGKHRRIPFRLKPPQADQAPSVVAEPAPSPATGQAPSPASTPDAGLQPSQFVIGTDKKIPIPRRSPGEPVGEEKPEEEREPEQPPVVQSRDALAEALAMLEAMPDLMFRIGPKGVEPVFGNGLRGRAATGTAADSGPAPATTEGKCQMKPLWKAVLEELARQHQPHTRKALETRQLQVLEFQVRGDGGAHDLEARLAPLDQAEVLALVRDVTDKVQRNNALIDSRNELENHLKDRNAELMRVNKMLKGEVELRSEQEEILKKNFRRLERLLEDTIGAITLIVEQRDPHVADHQRRVSLLAGAIGQELKLRNDQMRAVRMAAQLHDLGKIFIPAEILRKPGKLTPAEMSVVRTHPDTDYRILKRIDFPISIADVVRQHHERMDGSGYPQGLKGDNILMEARILAVADVVEGMVFERPYRVAPGLEAALKEIADNKGTLYDVAVAEACLRLLAEGRFKFEPAPEVENEVKAGLDYGGQDL